MQNWHPEQTPLVLKERQDETPDTVSFIFKAQDQSCFSFKPGQFVIVKVMIDGVELARAYSISSLPGLAILQLTIKRVAGGAVSNYLIDNLKPGDTVWTLGIAGDFNIIDCKPRAKTIFISAGCGVTPVLSMARYLCSLPKNQVDMLFLHRAHDMCNVISLREMNRLKEQCQHFDYHLLLSDYENNFSESVTQGKLTIDDLRRLCPDYQERSIYLCGPQGFMQDVQEMLQSDGFDMQHFHHEDFTPRNYVQDEASFLYGKSEASGKLTVSVPDFHYQAQVTQGALLLDVLDAGKVPLVAACRSGICGSCKCRVNKGRVVSSSYAALTPQEIEQGFVLACSSTITEDIEVFIK